MFPHRVWRLQIEINFQLKFVFFVLTPIIKSGNKNVDLLGREFYVYDFI